MLTKKSESGIMNIYCPLVIIDYEREHKLEGPSERAKQRNKNRMGKAEERTKLRSVKNYLEKRGKTASTLDALPPKFLEHLICHGLRLDLLQPGCIVFSMKIPPRLLVRIYHIILSSIFFPFSYNNTSFVLLDSPNFMH